MKVLVAFACLLVVVSCASVKWNRKDWSEYKRQYGKSYSGAEDTRRMHTFFKNMKKIEEHNALHAKGQSTFTMGMNKYGDMTHEEFLAAMVSSKRTGQPRTSQNVHVPRTGVKAPAAVDWRPLGYVTPVKDQGQCGSCWAFSTTGALEGSTFNATGKLISLSEQNLMDCSYSEGNAACDGGMQEYAVDYIVSNGGIDTEESYPYQEKSRLQCDYTVANRGATATGYVSILPRGDESVQLDAVAYQGPVSVSMDASHESFQLYSSGIYNDPLCKNGFFDLDHGVLAVGYGTDDQGNDYWIIKNSWGTSWGLEGYFWITRGTNECGIAEDSLYINV